MQQAVRRQLLKKKVLLSVAFSQAGNSISCVGVQEWGEQVEQLKRVSKWSRNLFQLPCRGCARLSFEGPSQWSSLIQWVEERRWVSSQVLEWALGTTVKMPFETLQSAWGWVLAPSHPDAGSVVGFLLPIWKTWVGFSHADFESVTTAVGMLENEGGQDLFLCFFQVKC